MDTATTHSTHSTRPLHRQSPISYSSWIREIIYVPRTSSSSRPFLAIFTQDKQGQPNGAMLYTDGERFNEETKEMETVELASWVPGLLEAGCGGQSVGRAYNRLVRGKGYAYQRVTGKEQVAELRAMMLQAKANIERAN